MKKTIALILAISFALVMAAGCGAHKGGNATTAAPAETTAAPETNAPSEETTAAPVETTTEEETEPTGFILDNYAPGSKVTIGVSGQGTTLVPWGRAVFGQAEARNIIFQKLLRVDNHGDIHLELAKELNKKDDVTYEIVLWDNIKDTNGNHFTTSDVVYSFDQYLATGNTGYVSKWESWEIVDDYTIIWHCNAPFAIGELGDQLAICNMVTQASLEASPDGMALTPVGTGPYMLESFEPGSELVLKVNEDFWMRDLDESIRSELWVYNFQNVETIDYKIIPDATQRAIAIQQGTVDTADNIADIDLIAMETDPNIQMVYKLNRPPEAFIFNCAEGFPCADVNLRKAIAYAIDNDSFRAGIGDQAYPVYGFMPNQNDSPESWLTGREYYDYDPAKAKEFLDKSGYNGETLKLMYVSASSGEGLDEVVILLQAQLKAAGINVELYRVDQGILAVERFDPSKWDMRFDQFGGGDWYVNVMRNFTAGAYEADLQGRNLFLIEEPELESLYSQLEADPTEANIEKYDDYFTFDQCYGYAICGVNLRSASNKRVNVVLGDRGTLMVPGAFTFNE